MTNFSVELSGKRLQYLKDIVPSLSRVALLINPDRDRAGRREYLAVSHADAVGGIGAGDGGADGHTLTFEIGYLYPVTD